MLCCKRLVQLGFIFKSLLRNGLPFSCSSQLWVTLLNLITGIITVAVER